ncbi:uncharacterized protein EKO05_0007245 [Ascochyta rabiei]|uniref:uncharacterized protein n=1 Tax=Didymella rabiei TaxID=5454 RepID=UPI0021FD6B5C|nr:uncharacterized protein EKO05_0007245 [Ascochyta rabiei]UPX16862.1 hypothetical protein EKO05_0007245 [Ascochyta rabiei]
MSRARLRGGAGQRQIDVFRWLGKDQGVNEKLDKGKGRECDTAVTYKGRKIGAPQPTSALNVLPPASRFMQLREGNSSFDAAPRPPFPNGYDVNNIHPPTSRCQDCNTTECTSSPLPTLVPAFNTVQPRPVTSNPFAEIYGNPDVIKAAPTAPPIDYATAGSLVNRPSALGDSQTGYGDVLALPKNNGLRSSGRTTAGILKSEKPDMKPTTQKMRVDRKWDKLPALPPGESPPEPVLKNDRPAERGMEDDGPFDTEEILRSLRPERLSLYHIKTPGRTVNGCVSSNQESHTIPPRTACDTTSSRVKPTNANECKAADDLNIRTREWDSRSCATDDLSVDTRLQQQEHLEQRLERRPIPQDQRRQNDICDNKEALHGLPNENALSPESAFYAELIDIVKHHHEQQRVIQRAFEAGEISEEHHKRQTWRYGTAMDQTILTNEPSIRNAISQPTSYAIYSALLEPRDPGKWQRIFAHLSVPSPCVGTAPKQHLAAPLTQRIRKAGQALRSLFVVPDDLASDPDSDCADTPIYASTIAVLSPNTPARLQFADAAVQTTAPSPLHRQGFAHVHQNNPLHVAAPTPHSTASTDLDNAEPTYARLAPKIDAGYAPALRTCGYEADVFVTVLRPGVGGDRDGKVVVGYGAGRQEKHHEVSDGERAVTEWPTAEW